MRLPLPKTTLRRPMVIAALVATVGLAPPESVQVGQIAPPVVATTAGGNFDIEGHYKGRYVILAFWSMKDAASARQFEELRKIRQGMAKENRLLIVDVCADDGESDHDTWLRFLKIQGKPDYGDSDGRGPVRFYSDSKWVNTFQGGSDFVSTKAYGVERLPEAFLIGPDRRFLAVRIPVDELGKVIAEALKKTS